MESALEEGQAVIEGPAGVTKLAPVVEIFFLAADIDHAVDGARSTQHLPARPEDLPSPRAGVRLGFKTPVDVAIGEGFAEAQRDVDPHVAVGTTGFQQHDLG